ncbi:hypothetical protein GOBAR_DD09090 [Gossypium barbadense]|nr:hypothetical protein GOBAR_DD09090 [Gossypium barbadense]
MRSLTDKIAKMEAELQAAEPVKVELQQAHSDAQNLVFYVIIECSFNFKTRISIKDIKSHPWFLKNLPRELTEAAQATYYRKENPTFSLQSVDEIMKIVEEAKVAPRVSWPIGGFG